MVRWQYAKTVGKGPFGPQIPLARVRPLCTLGTRGSQASPSIGNNSICAGFSRFRRIAALYHEGTRMSMTVGFSRVPGLAVANPQSTEEMSVAAW